MKTNNKGFMDNDDMFLDRSMMGYDNWIQLDNRLSLDEES